MRRNRLIGVTIVLGGLLCLGLGAKGEEKADKVEGADKTEKTEAPVAEPKKSDEQVAVAEPKLVEPQILDIAIRNGESPGWEQIRRVIASVGTNDFTFVVAHGFRITSTSERVTLTSPDGNYFMTFRILRGYFGAGEAREHVSDQIPTATIVEEYSKAAAGHEGPVFKMRGSVSGMNRSLRMALIPSPVGTLEFVLNAEVRKAAEAEIAFNTILRTCRSNERGKLDLAVRFLDRS